MVARASRIPSSCTHATPGGHGPPSPQGSPDPDTVSERVTLDMRYSAAVWPARIENGKE